MVTPLVKQKLLKLPEELQVALEVSQDVWLCGGAVLDILENRIPNDYDIFGASLDALLEFQNRLQSIAESFQIIHNSSAVTSLKIGGYKVQIIKRQHRLLPNIGAVLDSFPFHLNQFGYDGGSVYTTSLSEDNLRNRKVTANKITPDNAVEAILRVNNFGKKGYTVTRQCVKDIVKVIREMTDEEIKIQLDYLIAVGTDLEGMY